MTQAVICRNITTEVNVQHQDKPFESYSKRSQNGTGFSTNIFFLISVVLIIFNIHFQERSEKITKNTFSFVMSLRLHGTTRPSVLCNFLQMLII
jgi:hypothetical protein